MPTLSVIDARTLDSLRELGGDEPLDLLNELFGLLFINADAQVGQIRSGAAVDDLEQIMRAAHTLKGSAGSVGALEVAHLAGQIELLSRSRVQASWPRLADELESALGRLRETACGLGLKTAA